MVIRVLHYVGKMDRGGMETFIMNLYRNVDRSRIQFDFAVHTSEKGAYDDEIKALGGNIFCFPILRKNPIAYIDSWDRFWNDNVHRYDAFHFHTNSLANITALKMASRYGVKIIIVHSHSTYAYKGNMQIIHDLMHYCHRVGISRYANVLYACSHRAAHWLFGQKAFECRNIKILKNGIDLDQFTYKEEVRRKVRQDLGLSGKEVIGHVGKFIRVKNHDYLIDVFKAYRERKKTAVLLLVGDGNLYDHVKEKARDYNLLNDVVFAGTRSDVPELLHAMDIFVFPSLYEGLPLTLVEAQANGVPILASDRITNEVKMKDNCYFDSIDHSPNEWAERIENILLSHRDRRVDNRKLVEAGFDIKTSVSEYQNMLLMNTGHF